MEEQIDRTVETLCAAIEKQEEDGEYKSVAELTNALAALITAKANFKMSFRAYASSTTNRDRKGD